MTSRSVCLFVASLFAATVSAAFAQQPAGPPPQHHEMPPPKNLQVLPKDTTGPQLMAIMHRFTGDLGVHCTYCHAEDPATHRPDFASDANPIKNRARVMMRMTHTINAEYLTQLNDPSPEHVGCGTCHRGMPTPPEFVPQPEEHHEAPHPAPGAEAPSAH